MLFTKHIMSMVLVYLHALSAFAANGPNDPSQCDVLWRYARFGLIFKLYCGSTDPYVSSGPWKQHPIKNWAGVRHIRTTSPRHGEDLERGMYDPQEFAAKLQVFRATADIMVQKLSALNNKVHNVPDNPDVLLAHSQAMEMRKKKIRPGLPVPPKTEPECAVSLDGNWFNYENPHAPIPQYDYYFYDRMRQHWTNFQYLAQTTDLNDQATREQYAMLGVLASFSRGLVDPFINVEPTGKNSLVLDANFKKVKFEFDRNTLGLRSDRFLVPTQLVSPINNYPVYHNPPIVKDVIYGGTGAYAFFLDIELLGNLCSHTLSKHDHIVTRNSYDDWMVKLRTMILQVVEKLRAKINRANQHARCQADNAYLQANTDVLQHWETALQRFTNINGADSACILRLFAESPLSPNRRDRLEERKQRSSKAKSASKDLKTWSTDLARTVAKQKQAEVALGIPGNLERINAGYAAMVEVQKEYVFGSDILKEWTVTSPQNKIIFTIPSGYMAQLEQRLSIPTKAERLATRPRAVLLARLMGHVTL